MDNGYLAIKLSTVELEKKMMAVLEAQQRFFDAIRNMQEVCNDSIELVVHSEK